MSHDPCIDDETLARMVADTLDHASRSRVLDHLERCDACRRLVADAVQLADETRTIAGRYRLEGELGRGGMGMVYRAHDDVLDRRVAIKLLPAGTAADARARAKLIRESKAMAKLRHPNVVAIHDAGHHGDQLYVAMEHIPGPTLRRWLAERTRTPAEILAVFVQAARGLAAAHAVGVVHRDFKPDNVLLDDDGQAKVADFGLARSELDETGWDHDDGEVELPAGDGLTLSGPGAGTPAYMPPEQHGGGEVDRRADVFSLCVSLWEALYGVRPFVESSIEARLTAIRRGQLIDAPDRHVDLAIRRVLARGLAHEPSQRFTSVDALVDALESVARRSGRRRRWLAAGLGAVAVVTAGTALALATRPETCVPAPDRLDAAWSTAAAARVKAAVFATHPAVEAQVSWSRVRPAIEGVVAALDRERVAACEARAVDAELAARRDACLRIERTTVAFRIELAADGDVDAVNAIDLGASTGWCRELADEITRPPGDDADIEIGIAETAALVQLGRSDDARLRARTTLAEAERRGDVILVARARFELGKLETDPAQASASLQQAAREAGDEHVTAAMAWIYAGYYAEPDEAERCLAHANAELAELDNEVVRAVVQMRAAILEGEILIAKGDADGTRAAFERALTIARDHTPSSLPDILFLATWAAWAQGDLTLALSRQLELVRWHERAFTPHGQTHARALWNLADLQLEAGELAAARASIRHAHEVAGTADDADHRGRRLLSEAEIRLHLGELDAADAVLAEADALQRSIPTGALDRGKLEALRGQSALLHEHVEAAIDALAPALAVEGSPVDFGMDASDARAVWGEAMRQAGRANAALEQLEPDFVELRRAHPRLRETARLALVTGWLLHALERDVEAAARFDEALVLLLDPCERAWADVGRVATGHAAASVLAEARDVLERHTDAHRAELATIAALQAAR